MQSIDIDIDIERITKSDQTFFIINYEIEIRN